MKHIWLSVLLALFVACLLYLGFRSSSVPLIRYAEKGIVDLRDTAYNAGPVNMAGEWRFTWKALHASEKDIQGDSTYIQFPSLWKKNIIDGKQLSRFGYATYYATVLLPKDTRLLSIELPDAYSAVELYINGKLAVNNGKVGKSREESQAFWATRLIQLPASSDTVTIAMQVANYWHVKGGTKKPLKIGLNDHLMQSREKVFALNLVLTGSLFMGGLFFLGLYLFGKHDKAILYFSLFCIMYSYRMVGSDVYVLHSLFPNFNWLLSIKLEYLTLTMSIGLFIRYTEYLFPEESKSLFVSVMTWFCFGYAAVILVAPPIIFTSLLNIFLFAMFLCIAYAFYIYIQAARHKRTGSVYALISTAVMLLVFLLINLHFFRIIPAWNGLVFAGYVAFFFLQSLILSHRFAHTLKLSAKLAEEGLKAKTEFLSTMSHEIRTPLNAVIGMTHVLLGSEPRKDQEENLDVLLFSANNLLVIVNDILDYSKIEAGKINMERISMDLMSICTKIIAGLKEQAQEKKVDLQLHIDKNLTRRVMGDPTRIGQVMNNLVQNALKFTHKGWVRLSLTVNKMEDHAITITISVEDTGIGISKEKQQHIFERFTQADSSTSRSYGGTGLGLAICKKILELQGSRLQLESEEGRGSLFFFTQTFEYTDEPIEHSIESMHEKQEGTQLKGISILLVEDNPFNVMVAKTILERGGAEVDVATNGKEAIHTFNREKHQLILMDLHMPVMDGYEASGILRRSGETVPIVALTASTRNEVEREVFNAGLTDILVKPFNPDDLLKVILTHVRSERV
jgi:signal transduction histidine kinase/CheY-like chemotaxis protein